MGKDNIYDIGRRFLIEGELNTIKPLGEGFINDTFLMTTKGEAPDYILQRKNGNIFKNVPGMMDNIVVVTEHLKQKIAQRGGDPMRETLTVIRTADGKPYVKDGEGQYWAATTFITDTVTHDKAQTPLLAKEGGYGTGRFQAMLADLGKPLAETLPGFHNIKFRFEQWDNSVKNDAAGRVKEVSREIEGIERRRKRMGELWSLYEKGVIPKRVTHNDAKMANMLFDRSGHVLCMIDLDTVMDSMCMNDFADSIRTYANTGTEDDRDLSRVSMSMEMFEAYTEGYLAEAAAFLTDIEAENLAFSALYITYEQVLRFLMDYIDGDTYYKVKNPRHNLERTHAQFRLLESMEEQYDKMRSTVERRLREIRDGN